MESLLLIPMLVLLFVGAMEIGKITLTYFTLHKALRGAAGMATQLRGADFCNGEDAQLTALKSFVVLGPAGDAANPIVRDLTSDRIVVTPERADTATGEIGECGCGGPEGCLLSEGGRQPEFLALSIDGGYSYTPRIPFRTLDPILLRPHVRVPYGGY